MKIVLKLGRLSIALGPWWSFNVKNYVKGYGFAFLDLGPISMLYIHASGSIGWGLAICPTNEEGL